MYFSDVGMDPSLNGDLCIIKALGTLLDSIAIGVYEHQ
jgi:hypothetical protein